MKLCFPVFQDKGLESTIFGHFASAPIFVVIDTDTGESFGIPNCDELAPEAGCDPCKALANKYVETVVVAGIGDGFLQMLNMLGATVLQAQSLSVAENVDLFRQDALGLVGQLNSADEGRCGEDDAHGGCGSSRSHEDGCDHGLC